MVSDHAVYSGGGQRFVDISIQCVSLRAVVTTIFVYTDC